jgi:hypothetical protein
MAMVSSLEAGGSCQATANLQTARFTQVATGRVELLSLGWASVFCKLQ